MMMDPQLQLTAALMLSALFAASGWHKLRARDAFEMTLSRYDLLAQRWLSPVSRLLPLLEMAAAAALLLPASRAFGGVLALLLLGLYTLAIGINLLRGRRHIDCGCGDRETGLSGGLVLRNIYLVAIAAVVAVAAVDTTAVAGRDLYWLDFVFSLLGACALGLIYASWTQLLANQTYRERRWH